LYHEGAVAKRIAEAIEGEVGKVFGLIFLNFSIIALRC
jgi:hypothetical protein